MSEIRGVVTNADGAQANVLLGEPTAILQPGIWAVRVYAVVILPTLAASAPVAPDVMVEFSSGQVSLSKGPAPTRQLQGTDDQGVAIVDAAFMDEFMIFQGTVSTAGGSSEGIQQVLKIDQPTGTAYVYWKFERVPVG